MSTAANIEIEIFRLGRQTDKDGQQVDFTAADAEAMIAAYSAATDPAPLVVGHPKEDAPAYGWAASLRLDGDVIVATPEQVEPAFAEMVNAGRFKRISTSFYPPKHPSNPKPGVFYPKHIGFLGAAAPAVKGLKTVSFSDGANELLVLEFSQESDMDEAELARRMAALEEREQAIAARETAAGERETSFAEREQAIKDRDAAARHNLNLAFAEGMIQNGKLTVAGRDIVVGVMDSLSEEATLSFSEGGDAISPLAAFRQLLEGAGKIIDFKEYAGGDVKVGDAPDPASLAARALAFQATERAAGREITVAAAVRHVERNPAA